MTEFFTGANPVLLYTSLASIIGGLLLIRLIKAISVAIVDHRIRKVLPSLRADVDGPGGLFAKVGMHDAADLSRKVHAEQQVMSRSGGLVLAANISYYACCGIVGSGAIGLVIYIASKVQIV